MVDFQKMAKVECNIPVEFVLAGDAAAMRRLDAELIILAAMFRFTCLFKPIVVGLDLRCVAECDVAHQSAKFSVFTIGRLADLLFK